MNSSVRFFCIKIINFIFIVSLIGSSVFCRTADARDEFPENSLPPEFNRSGMISSSTYQVVVSLEDADEENARRQGLELAVEKATSLISQEVFINRNLSLEGRKKIRKLVEEKGKIVRFQKKSDKIYSIVYQVTQPRIKKYLESIR